MQPTPSGCGLPVAVAADLEATGLNVAGVLDPARYDDLVPEAWRCAHVLPGARSVLVLGSGGRALETALKAWPERLDTPDPVDDLVRARVGSAVRRIEAGGWAARAFFYWQSSPDAGAPGAFETGDAGFADFVALARAAGLGETGRLRMLLHPRHGPWLAIRAIVVSTLSLAVTASRPGLSPCPDCAAPCASACPGGALDGGDLDLARCQRTRQSVPACEEACAARRACVIGPGDSYSPVFEAYLMRSSLRAARHGLGRAQNRG
jgi:epoxyqueuosine reductase QueG